MIYETVHFTEAGDKKSVCSCCGTGGLSIAILIVLEHIREKVDAPVVLLSGARCSKYNQSVGGSKNSEHKSTDEDPLSDAVDITVKSMSTKQLHLLVKSLPYANLLGIGYYPEKGFIHVDTRGLAARW
tara:strand:+ start:3514 stop:3897 length:384 start_codon:yes stop_codon:yes gene_type:complete